MSGNFLLERITSPPYNPQPVGLGRSTRIICSLYGVIKIWKSNFKKKEIRCCYL